MIYIVMFNVFKVYIETTVFKKWEGQINSVEIRLQHLLKVEKCQEEYAVILGMYVVSLEPPLWNQEKENKRMRNKETSKMDNKMSDLNLSIITVNVNVLNTPMKRQRLEEYSQHSTNKKW